MITSIDSSVLLDIATNDPNFGLRSANAIKQADQDGRIIVSEFVVAEILPICGNQTGKFLDGLGIGFVASCRESAMEAGESFGVYLSRGGKRGRIVADFLIAAHSTSHSDRLLTRDDGFQRDYFSSLTIWYP